MRSLACVLVMVVGMRAARADVPVLKPDAAIAAALAALATPDAKATPGTATKVAWVDKLEAKDVATVEQAWRAAIAAANATVVFEQVDAWSITFVVEGASKARVLIAANPWNGAIQLTARPLVGTKLRGACVVPPVVTHAIRVSSHGIDQRGEGHHDLRDEQMVTARMLDLDGDAIPEVFVPAPASPNACRDETPLRVYVMRGTCGHDVGVVGPGWWDDQTLERAPDATGLRPLTFVAEHAHLSTKLHGIPELQRTTRTFAARKGRYVKTGETSSSGTCHHCSVWWCSAAPTP